MGKTGFFLANVNYHFKFQGSRAKTVALAKVPRFSGAPSISELGGGRFWGVRGASPGKIFEGGVVPPP